MKSIIAALLLVSGLNTAGISARPNPEPDYYCKEADNNFAVELNTSNLVTNLCGSGPIAKGNNVNFTTRFNRLQSTSAVIDLGVTWDPIPGAVAYTLCFSRFLQTKHVNAYLDLESCITVDGNQTSLLNYRDMLAYRFTTKFKSVFVIGIKADGNECFEGTYTDLKGLGAELDCNCSGIIKNDFSTYSNNEAAGIMLKGSPYNLTNVVVKMDDSVNLAPRKVFKANVTWDLLATDTFDKDTRLRLCFITYRNSDPDSPITQTWFCQQVLANKGYDQLNYTIPDGTSAVAIATRVLYCHKQMVNLDHERLIVYSRPVPVSEQIPMPFGFHVSNQQGICFKENVNRKLIYTKCSDPDIITVYAHQDILQLDQSGLECVGFDDDSGGNNGGAFGIVPCQRIVSDGLVWSRYRRSTLNEYELIVFDGKCIIVGPGYGKLVTLWGEKPKVSSCSDLVDKLDSELGI